MRVAILGSKPGEKVVDSDALYIANGGFLTYPQAVAAVPRSVLVLSAGAFSTCLSPKGAVTEEARALYDGLSLMAPSRVVVTANEYLATAVAEFITRSFPTAEHSVLLPQDREHIFDAVTGCAGPLLPDNFFRLEVADVVHHLEQLTAVYRLRQRGAFVDVPHFFRPSTGVFALACALSDYGEQADYVLCGIGMKGRGVHGYHAGANATAGMDHGLIPHVDSDIQVLRMLARRFRITSTNAELCEVCGLEKLDSKERDDH